MDELIEILESIDGVLTERHATTQMTLTIGIQLVRSAFAQIANDNPGADMITLADSISETLNGSLRHSILYPLEIPEA